MDRIGAVILAAGLSRRMRQRNKLLLIVDRIPMIRHVVQTYITAVDGNVYVVTRFQAAQIKAALCGLPIRFIHNSAYEKGQPF